jgi:hypothetical protein
MIPYEDKDFETVAGLVSRLASPPLLLTTHSGLVPEGESNQFLLMWPTDVFRYVVKQQKRPTMPDHCPARLAKLIGACLEHDPRKRPSFKTILEGQVLDESTTQSIIVRAVQRLADRLLRPFYV